MRVNAIAKTMRIFECSGAILCELCGKASDDAAASAMDAAAKCRGCIHFQGLQRTDFLNYSQQRMLVWGRVGRLGRSHSSRAYVTKVVGEPRGLTTSGLFSFQGANIPPLFQPMRLCRNAVVAQRP